MALVRPTRGKLVLAGAATALLWVLAGLSGSGGSGDDGEPTGKVSVTASSGAEPGESVDDRSPVPDPIVTVSVAPADEASGTPEASSSGRPEPDTTDADDTADDTAEISGPGVQTPSVGGAPGDEAHWPGMPGVPGARSGPEPGAEAPAEPPAEPRPAPPPAAPSAAARTQPDSPAVSDPPAGNEWARAECRRRYPGDPMRQNACAQVLTGLGGG